MNRLEQRHRNVGSTLRLNKPSGLDALDLDVEDEFGNRVAHIISREDAPALAAFIIRAYSITPRELEAARGLSAS